MTHLKIRRQLLDATQHAVGTLLHQLLARERQARGRAGRLAEAAVESTQHGVPLARKQTSPLQVGLLGCYYLLLFI